MKSLLTFATLFILFTTENVFAQSTPIRPSSGNAPIVEPAGPAPVPRVAGPQVAGPQAPIAPIPLQPEWVAKMTPAEQKWVDDVLQYWETSSEKIKLFECKFERWDYDGGFLGPDGKWQTRTYATGIIKYGQPDKGLYKVEKLILNQPGAPGQKPQQIEQNPELGEHWICNGKEIWSFEANKKQVTITPLPPQMQGKAIADGPLPFMFGAKAETIKARYWVRNIEGGPQGKYWLEAVPKSREDAQNFKQVRITLDQGDFLPDSLEIFGPNYNPPQNDARQTYRFAERSKTDAANIAAQIAKGLDPLGIFNRDFFNPRIPLGWQKVAQGGQGNIPAAPSQQARPPAAPVGPKTR
ncbi:MAG TPA: TIGR03009 domain-containing protein [Pirellulaceae bacterium]|jgi:TIGR03009 family protein